VEEGTWLFPIPVAVDELKAADMYSVVGFPCPLNMTCAADANEQIGLVELFGWCYF
jgi:hypothetical protein